MAMRPIVLKGGWADGLSVGCNYARCISMPGIFPDGAYSDTYMVDGDVATFSERIKFATQNYHSPITEAMFNNILELTPKDGFILELGSGTSTYWLAKERIVWSVEDDIMFYGAFQPIYRYLHCPQADGWYRKDVLQKVAAQCPYHTVLVDGPNMQCDVRIAKFLESGIFSETVPWFFDDVAEGDAWPTLKKYATEHNRELLVADKSVKPWAVMMGRKDD